ncbi:hypothetical protein KUTeg_011088 [Tegillarca granosa]|uniref:Uncharacterized protein n=1 Tax=Tegillarca granosa TaxID=220873 RepID=A0ABQ9F2W3_TEGGR|nr:hypothetical protein KUTeg_011088 [Tegillarca granosa]
MNRIGLIDYIENGKTRGDPSWHGYALAFAMPLLGEVDSLFYTNSMHVLMSLGLQVKSALIGAIYEKSLTMSNKAKKNYTIGEIVNLMSVDCLRIQDAFMFSYNIMLFPVAMVVGIFELWAVMDTSTLASIIVIIIIGLINAVFGKLQEYYQQRALFLKGKRIKLLNEVLNGIKMYAWETVFTDKIIKIRIGEMRLLSRIAVVTAFSILFSIHSPFLMHYFLILAYILTSAQFFDPQKAFVTLSLVNILRYPLTVLPFVITGVIQAYVSIGRIQDYLWKEDLDTDNTVFVESSEYAVKVNNASFTWDPESPIITLKDINLRIPDGQLIAVVGQVGAGKSSLISAILGEMEKIRGRVEIKGSIAYVPQEAWIQNLTVRDNILYGKPYIEKKYQKVLDACALTADLKILSGGDMTEIGEKGINISGGQKQRVSLARAVYNNADIYLLDDPLSAVDSHVGKHLFKNVIGPDGMLRKKTRILVTHGVHWIPKSDYVVVMENGKISESGTYQELLLRKGSFAEFVKTYLLEDDDTSDESDPEIKEMKETMLEQVEQITSDGMSDTERFHRESVSTQRRKRYSFIFLLVFKHIKFSVICAYVKAMGVLATLISLLFMTGFQGLNVYGNFWLTFWTEDEILRNPSFRNTTEFYDTNTYYLVVWSICLTLFALIALLRIVQASGSLHSSMLNCIIRSPMSFFDTTPVGRMMNRFSSDIDILDDRMPRVFRLWAAMFFTLIGILVVISVSTPEFLIAIIPVGILYVIILVQP